MMNAKAIGGFLLRLVIAWPLAILIVLMYSLPNYPKTKMGWLYLIVLGPPLYVLVESVGGWVFSEKHSRAISKRKFSILRILFGVVVMASAMATAIWLSGRTEPVNDFETLTADI